MRWLRYLLYGLLSLVFLYAVLPYVLPRGTPSIEIPPQPFVDSQWRTLDSVRWHFRLDEPFGLQSTPQTVLMIHGFGGSTANFESTSKALYAANYRVLRIDLPAFGYSTRGPMPADELAQLWQIADDMGMGQASFQPIVLLGHSMGAGVVSRMAALHPERVRALVLVNGGLRMGERGGSPWSQLLVGLPPSQQWVDWYARRSLFTPEHTAELLRSARGNEPSAADIEAYLKPLTVAGTAPAILGRMLKPQAAAQAEALTMPVLILWGEKDQWVPLRAGEAAREKLPHSEWVVIEGAGHLPMETHAAEFERSLLDFLGRVAPTSVPREPAKGQVE